MIKGLTTTLFQVQDYYDKTQLLAKGISYYCGVLYYRLDWLHENVTVAIHSPFQQKLLWEILLVVSTLSIEQVEEYTWSHLSLLLHDMFSSIELQAIETNVRDCIHILLPTLTPDNRIVFEIQYLGENEMTKDENLNEILAELKRLDNIK